MVRLSKQERRRMICPKRPAPPAPKTGPKKNQLPLGFKAHKNAVEGSTAASYFIPIHKT